MSISAKAKTYLQELKVFIIGILGSLILRIVSFTVRWEVIGLENDEKYWPQGKPRIIAFWHGHQLLMPWIYRKGRKKTAKPFIALISQHQDGRFVAKIMRHLGLGSVAGSSTRRGLGAMYALIDKLKTGSHVAITPDGPKGPIGKVKSGVIRIAERSGASIYPAAIAAEKSWTFGSWDKMFLPKPFTRVVLMMGQEIVVPSPLSSEEVATYTSIVESAMQELAQKADTHKFT